jgi:hypothetical protein
MREQQPVTHCAALMSGELLLCARRTHGSAGNPRYLGSRRAVLGAKLVLDFIRGRGSHVRANIQMAWAD